MVKNRLYIDYKFEINNQIVFVEYNGIQHYEVVRFGSHVTDLAKQKIRDGWLREYCKNNNIILVEIDGRKYNKEQIMVFLEKSFEEIGLCG